MKFRRDLDAEVAKFFKGTPDERVAAALRAGNLAVELYRASLPAGTSLDEARRRLRMSTRRRRARDDAR